MLLKDLKTLTDDDLIALIASLTGAAREKTADLVAHLAELEARGLHLAQGFRSLYGYCRHVLHLSEHEAYNRMEAAHAARRFPVILRLLAEGHLHLTAVCLLAPRLGDENHLALLGGAIHKSKRDVEELLVRWFPKETVPSSVRRVPAAAASAVAAVPREQATGAPVAVISTDEGDGGPVLTSPATPVVPAPVSRAVSPLATDRYQVKFTTTAATIDKLKRAEELLSHAIPDGSVAKIFDRALDALLLQAARQKHAATNRPRRGRGPARESRAIPAAVEREVWGRDGGRCAFVATGGRRCDERKLIEFHHLRPWIAGGPPTVDNIALRCRAHNAYEAARYFGPIRAAMDAARTRSGTSSGPEQVPR
jgi:hypothetical protein